MYAQVAELVDALVSNTNVFGRAGSSPALGTKMSCWLLPAGHFYLVGRGVYAPQILCYLKF